jgi:hypothetical protein
LPAHLSGFARTLFAFDRNATIKAKSDPQPISIPPNCIVRIIAPDHGRAHVVFDEIMPREQKQPPIFKVVSSILRLICTA